MSVSRIFRSLSRLRRKFTYLIIACVILVIVYIATDLSKSPTNENVDSSSLHKQQQHWKQMAVENSDKSLHFVSTHAIGQQVGGVIKQPERTHIELMFDQAKSGVKGGKVDMDHLHDQEMKNQNTDVKATNLPVTPVVDQNLPARTRPVQSRPARSYTDEDVKIPSSSGIAYKFTGPTNDKQKAIVDAFMHAWNAYKKYAWGHDELKPLSKSYNEWMGFGLTIVDSIDTIHIMGLKTEYDLAREWIMKELSFKKSDVEVSLFETTIRALGGLLSIYHLSGDKIFLDKALELGNGLFPCFGGMTKVPCNRINIQRGMPSFIEISTAETGSIQLEFRDLSRSTNTVKFEAAVADISNMLHALPKLDGLVPCFINPFVGVFHVSSQVSVGASCDSYYEYLLKQWLQTGKTNNILRDDYLIAVDGIQKRLLRFSEPGKFAYVGSYASYSAPTSVHNAMEHLACFLPGTLALGVMHGLNKTHLEMAKQLMRGCYEMYRSMPTGLSPEVALFNMDPNGKKDVDVGHRDRYNIHRPETVESLFYLYRLTNDSTYRDWAWEIFQSFERYTKLTEGYAGIDNVLQPELKGYMDKMETFYLAETLKYLYLMFSDDPNVLRLDEFVFNTEAHPLPIYSN